MTAENLGLESAGWLAPVLGKGFLLLLLGFAMAAVIGKRRSAAGGRTLWISMMVALVFLAAFEWATPKWGVPIHFLPLAEVKPAPAESDAKIVTEQPGDPAPPVELEAFELPIPELASAAIAPLAVESAEIDPEGFAPLIDATLLDQRPNPVESESSPTPIKMDETATVSPFFLIACIWLAGTLFLAGRFTLSRLALRRLERRSGTPGASWSFLADHLARKLGLRETPRLLISQTATVPMAWGLARPRILLPENANDLDASSRRYLLQHELSHIVHRDSLALLISQVAVILHWPNPLVWLAHRRLRLAQERACDDAAMRCGGTPADYAELLIDIAKRGRETPFSAASVALTMANGSSLKNRINAILDPAMKRNPPRKLETLLTVLVLAGLTLGLAGLAVSADKPKTADRSAEKPELKTVVKEDPAPPTLLRYSDGTIVAVRVFDDSDKEIPGPVSDEVLQWVSQVQDPVELRDAGKKGVRLKMNYGNVAVVREPKGERDMAKVLANAGVTGPDRTLVREGDLLLRVERIGDGLVKLWEPASAPGEVIISNDGELISIVGAKESEPDQLVAEGLVIDVSASALQKGDVLLKLIDCLPGKVGVETARSIAGDLVANHPELAGKLLQGSVSIAANLEGDRLILKLTDSKRPMLTKIYSLNDPAKPEVLAISFTEPSGGGNSTGAAGGGAVEFAEAQPAPPEPYAGTAGSIRFARMAPASTGNALEQKLNWIMVENVPYSDLPLSDVLMILEEESRNRGKGSTEPPETGGIDIILLREARGRIQGLKRESERYARRLDLQQKRVAEARDVYRAHQAEVGAEVKREVDEIEGMHQDRLEEAQAEVAKLAHLWDAVKTEDPVSLGARAMQEDSESALAKACQLYDQTQRLLKEGQKEGVVTVSEVLKQTAEARDRLETAADRYLERIRDDLRLAESRLEKVSTVIQEMKGRRAAVIGANVSGLELEQAKQTYQNELRDLQGLKREAELFQADGGSAPEEPRITLNLSNVPLGEVLKYVAQLAGLAYEVQAHAVVFGTPEEIEAMRTGKTGAMGGSAGGRGNDGLSGFEYSVPGGTGATGGSAGGLGNDGLSGFKYRAPGN